MPETLLTAEQILALLAETPPRLAALTADLTAEQLRAAPGDGEWSANDVLAHLRSCADVWGNCVAVILAQEMPTIRTLSPRTYIRRTDYPGQEFRPSMRAFTAQRTALLAELEALPPEAWSRTATVTGAGKPLVQTMHLYAQGLARHERPHVKQIARIVEKVRT